MSEVLERSQAGASPTWLQTGFGKTRQLIIDTTTFRIHVMDGTTPGGHPVAMASDVTAMKDELITALENIILANEGALPSEDDDDANS